jgi:hypothetical protein
VTFGLVFGVLATAALAIEKQPSEVTSGYDPFEEAAPLASRFASEAVPGHAPVNPKDERASNVELSGHGLARLASEEQLPGLPSTANPSDQAKSESITLKPACQLTTDIQLPGGVLPRNYWGENPQPAPLFDTCGTNRSWPVDCYHWCPTCLCYQPLYFEEPNLERYGYGCSCYTCCGSTCLQSACSAAHFFGTVPALPYMMAANCPCECNYALGDYRPGSCPPWRRQCCAPYSFFGAGAEGAAAYGLVLMLP